MLAAWNQGNVQHGFLKHVHRPFFIGQFVFFFFIVAESDLPAYTVGLKPWMSVHGWLERLEVWEGLFLNNCFFYLARAVYSVTKTCPVQ